MSEDAFTQPLRGDKFEAEQFDGALLLFYPTEYVGNIPTQHGDAAVVDTHIVALDRVDNTGQPVVLRDARIFGRALVPQLKGAVGGKAVLGRLGRGQNTKGNPPWILKDFSEQDSAFARQYMAAHPDPRIPATGLEGPLAQAQAAYVPPTSNGYAPQATATGNPAPAPGQYQPAAHVAQTPFPQGAPQGQYGAAVPAPPAAPVGAPVAPTRDPQLVAHLVSKGVDVSKLPADADLALIAQTLG